MLVFGVLHAKLFFHEAFSEVSPSWRACWVLALRIPSLCPWNEPWCKSWLCAVALNPLWRVSSECVVWVPALVECFKGRNPLSNASHFASKGVLQAKLFFNQALSEVSPSWRACWVFALRIPSLCPWNVTLRSGSEPWRVLSECVVWALVFEWIWLLIYILHLFPILLS